MFPLLPIRELKYLPMHGCQGEFRESGKCSPGPCGLLATWRFPKTGDPFILPQTTVGPRYPSSTLFPFLLWGLLINLNIKEKGALIIKGLLGNPGSHSKDWKRDML